MSTKTIKSIKFKKFFTRKFNNRGGYCCETKAFIPSETLMVYGRSSMYASSKDGKKWAHGYAYGKYFIAAAAIYDYSMTDEENENYRKSGGGEWHIFECKKDASCMDDDIDDVFDSKLVGRFRSMKACKEWFLQQGI